MSNRTRGRGPLPGAKYLNTRKLKFDVLETLRSKDFDPLEKIIWTYNEALALYEDAKLGPLKKNGERGEVNPWVVQSHLAMLTGIADKVAEYIYPKRKALEHTGENGEDLFKSFSAAVKTVRAEIDAERRQLEIEIKAKDVTHTDGT